MKWLKAIFTAISVMLAGMFGGQKSKPVRRFGIPGIATLSSLASGFRFKDLSLLLLIPILSMGYGVDSIIFNLVGGNETLCRLIYATLVGLPFLVYGLKRGLVAIVALIAAFQVRAGSLGYIPWFGDILIEDICRYLILGILIAFNILFRGKNND
jgi:hypothetical protein